MKRYSYKKTAKKKRFFILFLVEIITGILAFFFIKNKEKILKFSKEEKEEAKKCLGGKEDIKTFWRMTIKHIKDFFIPHEGNNYKPKSLHPRSLAVYIFVAVFLKLAFTGMLFFVYPDPASMARIVAQEMIRFTNQARRENNLPQLEVNTALTKAALKKGEDMITKEYFSHDTPDGKKPWYWINKKEYDYVFAGENLAMDFTSGEMIHRAFLKSPTHRRNLLDPDYKNIGVAVVSGKMFGNDTDILVMFFGAQRGDLVIAKQDAKLRFVPSESSTQAYKQIEKNETSESIIVLGSESKSSSDLVTFIVDWMNVLFVAFVIYISTCLFLNIFIKIRIQYRSLILQSIIVLSLIASLLITKLHFIERITMQLKIL